MKNDDDDDDDDDDGGGLGCDDDDGGGPGCDDDDGCLTLFNISSAIKYWAAFHERSWLSI